MINPRFKFSKGDFVRVNGVSALGDKHEGTLAVVRRALGWQDGDYHYTVIDLDKRAKGGADTLQVPESWLTGEDE